MRSTLTTTGHRGTSISWEDVRCDCGSVVTPPGLQAPPGYYKCPVCHEATPLHLLERRLRNTAWGQAPRTDLISPYQRFYLSRDGGIPGFRSTVNPPLAAWDDTAQTAYRPDFPWRMFPTKVAAMNGQGTEAISAVPGTPDWKSLVLAYVSDPLLGGRIAGTAKGQLRWAQDFADCAHDRVTVALSVVSEDGQQVRGYLLPLSVYGSTNLYVQPLALPQNRFLANGDALTPVIAFPGDRMFLQIGTQPSTAPLLSDFVACYVGGQQATDLAENETDTTDSTPWFEVIR